MRLWAVGAVVCGLVGLVGLAGCSGGAFGPASNASQSSGTSGAGTAGSKTAGAKLTGTVHGGQQPIAGAHVYLFAANTTGYGGNGIAASANNASVSLLTSGTLDTSGGATNGDYYVTTDANGAWTITGDYTCTPGQQVYLYALGGNPGAGTNSAAGLMAALGTCPVAGNFLASTPYIVINEVSTIATAYAFAGFATDATHVSSSGTALAQTGIANAFANVTNLETLNTGAALATTPAGNGTVPQSEINTLANILAACINTNGPSSTGCTTLFANATADGTSTGAQPTDTASAAINIAHYPATNVANLYALASGTPPFAPGLSSAPNDWSVILFFGNTGGMYGDGADLYSFAIDQQGSLWMSGAGPHGVLKLSSTGVLLSPSTGFAAGTGIAIAIDTNGSAWMTDQTSDGLGYMVELSSSGTAISPYSPYAGFGVGELTHPYDPALAAIDGIGNVWITDKQMQFMEEMNSTGAVVSPYRAFSYNGPVFSAIAIDTTNSAWGIGRTSTTQACDVSKISSTGALVIDDLTGTALQQCYGLAIDHSNNIWIADAIGNISELDNNGNAISPVSGYTGGGLFDPLGIAIDGAGTVWVMNAGQRVFHGSAVYIDASLSEFSNTGVPLSPSTGFTFEVSTVFGPTHIAVDGSGNVWITNSYAYPNYFDYQLAEYVGIAAPVVTPIATGVKNNTLGTRP